MKKFLTVLLILALSLTMFSCVKLPRFELNDFFHDVTEAETTPYAESMLDSERKFYIVPNGIGLPSSPFSYTNMTSEFDGKYVYVRFTLKNSELYPYEMSDYGEHSLVFDTNYRLIDFK